MVVLHHYRRIVHVTMLFAGITFTAHTQSTKTKTSVSAREPAAETILRRSEEKLGGLQLWSELKGIKVTGTVHEGENSSSITWEDHWDSHYKMVRHTIIAGEDRKYLQNPDKEKSQGQQSSNTSKSTKRRLDFDPLTTLAMHAPGAAIALALNDHRYRFFVAHPAGRDMSRLDCVTMSKTVTPTTAPTRVTVCSGPDGTLEKATIELANVINPNQRLTETVSYKNFIEVHGKYVPKEISVQRPLGSAHLYSFDDYEMNPTLSANDFQEPTK